MSFRQDKDPGSVKSLLALLRSNQDRADSAGNSPTPSPATSTAIPDPYSLASNPFHQATYGYSGSSNAPNGYQAGYQSGSAPPASSLQDLLATLRQTNSPAPILNLDPSTSGSRNGTSSRSRRGAADDQHNQAHSWAEETGSSSSKRRRVEREVDPYAENVQPYEPDEEDGPPDNGIQEQVDTSRDAEPVVDLVAEEEDEQDDGMNRYGYTPEQMADLSIEQGRPIYTELLERSDVRDELLKLKKEQEELERHMWKKREEIVADYKKKLPTERPADHPDYKKVLKQRTTALNKFYAQRVLPFYDITIKKQLVRLTEIGFPCLGDPELLDNEVDDEVRRRRKAVLDAIGKAIGAKK